MDSISNGINNVNGVKNTFSSWDGCMSKAYCKWPVIIGIIIGSLIVLSIVWCCARCLCCGAQCCCGCLSCCNACCPGPRGGGRKEKGGYQPAPPTAYQQQYQPPPPMYPNGANNSYYGGGAVATARDVPQTATFDASRPKAAKVNEDALPAMPSWDNAQKRYVEEPVEEPDVEMEKLNTSHAQQETGLVTGSATSPHDRYYNSGKEEAGDLGAGGMQAQHAHATPYQEYASSSPLHQQRSPGGGPYSGQGYQQTTSPYSPNGSQAQFNTPYSQNGGSQAQFNTPYPQNGGSQAQFNSPYSQHGSQSRQNMYSSTSVVAPPTRQYSNGAASFYPGDDRHAQYQPPQQQYAQQSQYSPQPQYDPQPQQQAYSRAYEPSIAAPSYRTNDVASPVREDALPQQPQQYQPYGGVQRKPAVPVVPYGQQPSWRDI